MLDLKTIYQKLAKGELTKDRALQMIRSIKSGNTSSSASKSHELVNKGYIRLVPKWKKFVANSDVAGKLVKHLIISDAELQCRVDIKQEAKSLFEQVTLVDLASSALTSADFYTEIATSLFEYVQNVLKDKPAQRILIQLVCSSNDNAKHVGGLTGFAKTVNLENPNVFIQILIADTKITSQNLVSVLGDCSTNLNPNLYRYQHDNIQSLSWESLSDKKSVDHLKRQQQIANNRLPYKDDGVYLITGGSGGLGKLFIQEILDNTTQSKVIVTGRSAADSRKTDAIKRFGSDDSRVAYKQINLADLTELTHSLMEVEKVFGKLNGVLHLAGMTSDSFIIKKSTSEFAQVLSPKVTGTYNLDFATRNMKLDFFALFSSVASWLGNLGQSDYAAANGYLDSFVANRNQLRSLEKRNGVTVAINWPLWRSGGMQISADEMTKLKDESGVDYLETSVGMQIFANALVQEVERIAILPGNVEALTRHYIDKNISEENSQTLASIGQQRTDGQESSVRLSKDSADELLTKTQEYLCQQLASLLKMPSHRIEPTAPLEKYGIDSVMAINLTTELEKKFGSLSKTLFFEYQTIHELSEFFVEQFTDKLKVLLNITSASNQIESNISSQLNDAQEPASESLHNKSPKRLSKRRSAPAFRTDDHQQKSSNAVKPEKENIAIVGLSGRYPESATLDDFWANLKDGKDCIIEVPEGRWRWRDYYSEDRTISTGAHFSKWGGFIEGVDEFDPRFFNISPREAITIDPQERLFLQHAWMAVEDAGLTRRSLQIPRQGEASGQVGVYVGVMYGEYNLSGSLASIANRVSYVLNLHGPSMTLDTMCSSSLTAIHLACEDLKRGRTDLAIAGGVNVSVHPGKYSMLSEGQFISSQGQCQSFGEGGDGYIPGEGVGAVVLKRLSEAEHDGNHIYGVILGSALNHGGKTNGYTVPNPKAQSGVIDQALIEANITPRHISYIEAHGTGTKLGDPIEITSLSKAFHSHTNEQQFCLIGSAKSNIGHCESAAGIAGLTKVLLQIKHKKIVPSLHSSSLNPHIDFENTPFEVNQRLREWEKPIVDGQMVPRVAGISSFGAGGSNAHLVVQEYHLAKQGQLANTGLQAAKYIVLLSAKTEPQLLQKASDLLHFIENSESSLDIDLSSLAYTLQVGREPMTHRIGMIVSSVAQLSDSLIRVVAGDVEIDSFFKGKVSIDSDTMVSLSIDPEFTETVERWIKGNKLSRIVDLWANGLDIEWEKLHAHEKPRLMSLPVYPFAKEKYWSDANTKDSAKSSVNYLHPLLHSNTSDLNQNRYSASFNADEVLFRDRQVGGETVLPSVAYLEMARVAIANSNPSTKDGQVLELNNIVWGKPIRLGDGKQVSITLLKLSSDWNYEQKIGFEIYSDDDSDDLILCQGEASYSQTPAPTSLDIESLKSSMDNTIVDMTSLYNMIEVRGVRYADSYCGIHSLYESEDQILAHINLKKYIEKQDQFHYVLHPFVIESALQSAMALMASKNEYLFPFALEKARVIFPCQSEMFAWVRFSNETENSSEHMRLNIDLADINGNICVQFSGVLYQRGEFNVTRDTNWKSDDYEFIQPDYVHLSGFSDEPEKELAGEVSGERLNEFKKINFLHAKQSEQNEALVTEQKTQKPNKIKLNDSIDDVVLSESTKKTKVALLQAGLTQQGSSKIEHSEFSEFVELHQKRDGLYSITIDKKNSNTNTLSANLIEQILQALAFLEKAPELKVLLIQGNQNSFLSGGREETNEAITKGLYQRIVNLPCPVIAAVDGDAYGAGWLVAAACDFMVLSKDSQYAHNDKYGTYSLSQVEYQIFSARLGNQRAKAFALLNQPVTGEKLLESGWSCPIVEKANVRQHANSIAINIIEKPIHCIQLLKQQLARPIDKHLPQLSATKNHALSQTSAAQASPIVFESNYFSSKWISQKTLQVNIEQVSESETDLLLAEISNVISELDQQPEFVSLVISSDSAGFIPGLSSENEASVKSVAKLRDQILRSSLSIIGVLDKGAQDLAWVLALCFDLSVHEEDSRYCVNTLLSANNLWFEPIFFQNFGNQGREILLSRQKLYGKDLKSNVPTLTIAPKEYCLKKAIELAESWDESLVSVMTEAKESLNQMIVDSIDNKAIGINKITASAPAMDITKPTRIELRSEVIKATSYLDGVLHIEMEDRKARNMFSDSFVDGMEEIFDHIENNKTYKIVVLSGYDNYFASGGTKEGLLSIQKGKGKFTDIDVFNLPFQCKLPVISAMQGHAIGAGWAMGMYADFILFSEQSRYLNPYMSYGFTPGAGSTFILPEKIGRDLAHEGLFTANELIGKTLKSRNIPQRVLLRKDVIPAAIKLAHELAEQERTSLMHLKQSWSQPVRTLLNDAYEQELFMHEQTFVDKPEALSRINSQFDRVVNHDEVAVSKTSHVNASFNKPHKKKIDQSLVLNDIQNALREMLAEELHLDESEIGDTIEFIDLGLDSITGVTWIRKINDKYATAIEATKVYSYPTLAKLSRYTKQEAEQIANAEGGNEVIDTPITVVAPVPDSTNRINGAAKFINVSTADITKTLKGFLADELHLAEDEIGNNEPFIDIGLDSITGVTWIRNINNEYQTEIEATKVYSYPTLSKLSRYVEELLEDRNSSLNQTPLVEPSSSYQASVPVVRSANEVASRPRKDLTRDIALGIRGTELELKSILGHASSKHLGRPLNHYRQAVAVIGMAGQFPKAKNTNEFWQNIAESRNCVGEVSTNRWDVNFYYEEGAAKPGKTNSKWLGELDEYDVFDPLFFNISPTEAESMDPQQRVFLQEAWHCIEDAGYSSESLSGSKCGVFVGCASGDYGLLTQEQQMSSLGFTGSASSILAARVSYILNVQGPCLSIDTACSSSLVAIANACDSLNSGASDMAIAGGVYVMASPYMHIKTAQSGMLSQGGRCFTFDQRANGFVPGESVGVVMLKRLQDAEQDKDNILAIVEGWGVNQDGKTNGITAPNAESQTKLISDVYEQFQINPETIQLIEAHGTGTKLGDPIEIDGLKQAYKKKTKLNSYCAIGSVKSNIGHCLTAAGIAGFIKLLLAFKHKQLPPTTNYEKLNEHINLSDSPFYVNDELRDWDVASSEPRRAAISSFGFSGTNAHIVLSEYKPLNHFNPPVYALTEGDGLLPLPLSAKNSQQLIAKAKDLLAWLKNEGHVDMINVAYTLQVGRDAMQERIGFMASSAEDFIEKLDAFIAGQGSAKGLLKPKSGQSKSGLELIKQESDLQETLVGKWIKEGKISKILDFWVKGMDVDWSKFYGPSKPKQANLPGYPFSKERYWVEATTLPTAQTNGETNVLHPLLHNKVTGLIESGYESDLGDSLDLGLAVKNKLKRVNLPTYAFEKNRCWVENPNYEGFKTNLNTEEKMNDSSTEIISDLLDKVADDSLDIADALSLIENIS